LIEESTAVHFLPYSFNSAQPCSSHETAYVAEDLCLQQHWFSKISIRAKKKHTFRKIVASEVSRTEVGNDYGS
jgi:hypothetical protein